jgi:hypothetical protein
MTEDKHAKIFLMHLYQSYADSISKHGDFRKKYETKQKEYHDRPEMYNEYKRTLIEDKITLGFLKKIRDEYGLLPEKQETEFQKLSKDLESRDKKINEKLDVIKTAVKPSFKDKVLSQLWGLFFGGLIVGGISTFILSLIGLT